MPSERPEPGRRDRLLAWGAAVLVFIALAAVLVPALTIAAKKSQLQEQTAERLQITAAGQAGVVSTWLQGTRRLADPVVGSELRSEEHTSELQSLMRSSYDIFCLKKNNTRLYINTKSN